MTHVRFALDEPATTRIVIYALSGQRIRTLAAGRATAGVHEAIWDGRDDAGHNVASGVYLASMELVSDGGRRFRQSRPMTLLR